MSLLIEQYSDKSFVVLGDSKPIKDQLKQLGGIWNSHLKDNKMGWIFALNKRDAVQQLLDQIQQQPDEIPALEPLISPEMIPIIQDLIAPETDEEKNNKKRKQEEAFKPVRKPKQQKLDEFRYTPNKSLSNVASIAMISEALAKFEARFEEATGQKFTFVFNWDTDRRKFHDGWAIWKRCLTSSRNISDVVASLIQRFSFKDQNIITMHDLEHTVLRPSIADCFNERLCRKEAGKYVKPEYDRLIQLRLQNNGYVYQSIRERISEIQGLIKSLSYEIHDDFESLVENASRNKRLANKILALNTELDEINDFQYYKNI